MKNTDDTFLARWLSDELTTDEKKEFKNSQHYSEYNKIIGIVEDLDTPEYEEDSIFSNIEKKTFDKTVVRKLNFRYLYSAAAAILVLFGVFYFQASNESSFTTNYGEQLTINLPDGSKALLNTNSSLSFDENNWDEKRIVSLQGEAYFTVEKGSQFTVNTSEGNVKVLGTQFIVNSSSNFFEVKCYSGKVNVTNTNNESTILIKGNATRTINDVNEKWNFNTTNPFWAQGIMSFENTPFPKVLLALKNQFDITIKNGEKYKSDRFTGRFSNADLEEAIKTVFSAMEIEYTISDKTIIIK